MTPVALAVIVALLGTAAAAQAAPGDPFGNGEPACIQPDADTTKAANAMVTAYAKAVACVAKCHVQRAKQKLLDGTALQTCEDACRVKYDDAVVKGTKKVPTYDVQPNFEAAEDGVDATPAHHCADSEGPTITNFSCTSDPLVPGSGSCSFTAVDTSPPVRFECGLDEGPLVDCSAQTFDWVKLEPGPHVLVIVAYDRFGNQGPPNPDPPFAFTSRNGPGHLILIGHDYEQTDLDTSRILQNAVLLAPAHAFGRPIKIATFTGGATANEIANVRAAIEGQAVAPVSFGPAFSDGTSEGLRTALRGYDVLLIYDQNDSGSDLTAVGESWFSGLREYLDYGGVVIVLDGAAPGSTTPSNTCELLEGAQLLACGPPTNDTGSSVVDNLSGNPIAAGVGDYVGPVNTVSFASDPRASEVFSTGTSGTYRPVVLDRIFVPPL